MTERVYPSIAFTAPIVRCIVRRPDGQVLFLRIDSPLNAVPPELQQYADTAPTAFTTLPLGMLDRQAQGASAESVFAFIRKREPHTGLPHWLDMFNNYYDRRFVGVLSSRTTGTLGIVLVYDLAAEHVDKITTKTWGPPIAPNFQTHTLYWADPQDAALLKVLDGVSRTYLDSYSKLLC